MYMSLSLLSLVIHSIPRKTRGTEMPNHRVSTASMLRKEGRKEGTEGHGRGARQPAGERGMGGLVGDNQEGVMSCFVM